MKKGLSTALFVLSFLSFHASAAPELIAKSTLEFGDFEETANVEIQGDIQEDVLRLAERGVEKEEADYFVIDQVSEDTQKDLLVVSVTLYREHTTDTQKSIEARLG
ncbi:MULTISPECIES: hypothetical protein [unclassified Salinivibrio]|uniref:hypothetical protein n=1 Tax=unclassified Salinivibrio TaxID=2636825 RepID=UPI00128CE752|nr:MULTISPECIES: hypothetical protein [unclassified Salinivibrio]MPS31171.1 hypothetical protein [Salinivibrio sp. VYel7]MPX89292.1 hypothetical protein [Salinivibrio sp. VYel1]MPX92571.1 hypothetical protein [Salinivibrio sp. VYel9]MPX96931.1 hypothetical protein [Salinivibrio sp. VYel6]MPX98803.1 hypothetical protein [Salinivibrio sp. VYel4]